MAVNFNAILDEFKRTNWKDPGTWHAVPKTVVLLAILAVIPVVGYVADTSGQIDELEQMRNQENKLKDEIQALLARKQIIETLQADRAQTVHLLDELVKQMPEGVFLKSIIQKGMRVQLLGYAQSNARVSTLMRNIEASRWLGDPELIEVKAAPLDKRRVSEFTMFMSLKRAPVDVPPAPAGAPAPAAKKG